MATILTKKKDTTGAPVAGDLTNSTGGAELAVNTFDKRLYTKDSGGNVVEVGINPSSITTASATITGGTINGTTVGATTRAAGNFTTLDANGNVTLGDAATDTVTVNGVPTFATRGNIKALAETATITASAPGATTNFDAVTQAVQYYTSNASANFTFNIRGDSSTTLNSIMATGQSLSIALLVTNGGTAYYPNAFQVDGASVTPKWQGGTAITAGNASSIDAYVFTVIKTANATFTVLASQTKFA